MNDSWSSLLEMALHTGEGAEFEFKGAFPKNATSLAHEIAAFATSGGGILVLGVEDDGTLVGWNDAQERAEGVVQLVSPRPRTESRVGIFRGVRLQTLRVVNSGAPLYYVEGRPYLRDNSLSRPASPAEVIELVMAHYRDRDPEAVLVDGRPPVAVDVAGPSQVGASSEFRLLFLPIQLTNATAAPLTVSSMRWRFDPGEVFSLSANEHLDGTSICMGITLPNGTTLHHQMAKSTNVFPLDLQPGRSEDVTVPLAFRPHAESVAGLMRSGLQLDIWALNGRGQAVAHLNTQVPIA